MGHGPFNPADWSTPPGLSHSTVSAPDVADVQRLIRETETSQPILAAAIALAAAGLVAGGWWTLLLVPILTTWAVCISGALKAPIDKRFRGLNQWPSDLPGFRQTTLAYMTAMEQAQLQKDG